MQHLVSHAPVTTEGGAEVWRGLLLLCSANDAQAAHKLHFSAGLNISQQGALLYLNKQSNIPKHYKQIHVKHYNYHFVCYKILAFSFMKHACLRTGGQFPDYVFKMLKVFNKMSMMASVG